MKSSIPLLAGAAAIIAVAISLLPGTTTAQAAPPAADAVPSLPTGKRCEVTLDPRVASKKRSGGPASDFWEVRNQVIDGTVVALTSDWLVLKDGNFDHWIPREKILTLRISR
jgi:hypothetical protein